MKLAQVLLVCVCASGNEKGICCLVSHRTLKMECIFELRLQVYVWMWAVAARGGALFIWNAVAI